jgi:hypothetical protein
MKTYKLFGNKVSIALILFLLGGQFFLSSCDNNDEQGAPMVTSVRLLNPEKKDSTFTSARPGTQVLIEGQNLGGIKNIYFNDYESSFNSTYNTDRNLIVTIPSKATTEATNPNVPNKIRIVTSHGETSYDFTLEIPPPVIFGIVNENTLPGERMVIVGANLWLISKITFPGGIVATEYEGNEDGTQIEVTVPSEIGETSDVLKIEAKYGSVTSAGPVNKFVGSGMISNLTGSWESGEPSVFNWSWWGAQRPNDATLFPGTRGSYLQNVFGGVGADDGGWWNGNRSGNFDPVQIFTPAELTGSASDYALKFEINTKEPWTTALCMLRIGNDYAVRWKPFETAPNKIFHTDNKWVTVTVPLSVFQKVKDGKEGTGSNAVTLADLVNADGKVAYSHRFVSEADPITAFNAAFDNFRIVKIKN